MIGFEVKITGIPPLAKILGTPLGPVVRTILHDVGVKVKDVMASDPGPVHKPVIWASAKQRRYVMAMLRQYGPWVRETHSLSQQLMGGWKVEDQSDNEVIVRSAASYGPWVQAAGQQTAQHRATGWITDQAAVDQVSGSGDVEQIMDGAFARVLSGRF